MREVSPAEIARQIEREGARHGLFPLIQDGACYVAQRTRVEATAGPVATITPELEAICNVTMAAPLGNVWKGRVQRHEFDHAKVYREAAERRRAARAAEVEGRHAERARELKKMARRFGAQDTMAAAVQALRLMKR